MKRLLDRLWRWYGKRRGFMRTYPAVIAFGSWSRTKYAFVFRGVIPPGTVTVYFDSRRAGPFVWNRSLTDFEIQEITSTFRNHDYD